MEHENYEAQLSWLESKGLGRFFLPWFGWRLGGKKMVEERWCKGADSEPKLTFLRHNPHFISFLVMADQCMKGGIFSQETSVVWRLLFCSSWWNMCLTIETKVLTQCTTQCKLSRSETFHSRRSVRGNLMSFQTWISRLDCYLSVKCQAIKTPGPPKNWPLKNISHSLQCTTRMT